MLIGLLLGRRDVVTTATGLGFPAGKMGWGDVMTFWVPEFLCPLTGFTPRLASSSFLEHQLLRRKREGLGSPGPGLEVGRPRSCLP